ncbi:MAG: bacitracin ABC transporter ATP-binding protein [Planctomyces sp.]|nr:bacitracin ABC transporter ATP-binding protein [Planctomyces sp.]
MTTTNNPRFVEMSNIIKAYPNPYGDPVKVIDGFNLNIREGEVIGVIGHSGCGKSTVLTMLAGLNPVTAGGIVVDGREICGPGPDRSVVFQAPCLLPWMTAFGNVKLGVDRVYPHVKPQVRRELIEYYLTIVGLGDAMHRYPRELSGGMQQRVGIARAIALKPKVLLLDEPFGRLDSLTRMELQDVILNILDREKLTTVLITHDVDEAIYMCDRVCMMTNGPGARVGNLLTVPFERPRRRSAVVEHPRYYDYRAEVISFLEEQEALKEGKTGNPSPASYSQEESDPTSPQSQIEVGSDPELHTVTTPEEAACIGQAIAEPLTVSR